MSNAAGGWALISYAHKDADLVRQMAGSLRLRRIDVWIDWEDIHLGSNWQ